MRVNPVTDERNLYLLVNFLLIIKTKDIVFGKLRKKLIVC